MQNTWFCFYVISLYQRHGIAYVSWDCFGFFLKKKALQIRNIKGTANSL